MRISAHCNITNPETAGYPYLESIRSYADFCDEVIVVDGGTTDGSLEKIKKIPNVEIVRGEDWEDDFDWLVMPKNLQLGFEKCTGDRVIKFDVDYILDENEAKKLKEALSHASHPVMELKKVNFVTANRAFEKDYYGFVINKKDFKAIGYGLGRAPDGKVGASFLYPIVKKNQRKDGLYEGQFVRLENMRVDRHNIDVHCYDFTFMTKEQVIKQRVRFLRSLYRFLGNNDVVDEEYAFNRFLMMMKRRYKQANKIFTELDHSKFIRKKVEELKPEQFGYNGWGLLE